ncbi:DUF4296 domain-containing protein [Flavobacterium sp. LMO8]|uniref:DUF4296 domain-containing protein n=1 Tax=Flavobacterium sp. LMO8 TaxID=2654244 RepID=UPI0012927F44|nr:DUF4296 domain-containing protein [Flavobacterium sp. LMO8]MQP25219.1 DUF4296 domain-containing protein [Flavobacterium sp. LMO8]
MKQILFLLLSLLVFSCSKNPVPKPDNLLDEEVMVDIIYDVSILQATDGSMPHKLKEYNIEMDQYIFKKYKIDNITFRQNQRYYAADVRKSKRIYKRVIEKFEQEKSKISGDSNKKKDKDGKIIYEPVK